MALRVLWCAKTSVNSYVGIDWFCMGSDGWSVIELSGSPKRFRYKSGEEYVLMFFLNKECSGSYFRATSLALASLSRAKLAAN
eukprot:290724-Amphidinium_carterae.4